MKANLKTPLANYSKGFKSRPLLRYFDTLEEYLAKYYKPKSYLPYDEWLQKQWDANGDGKKQSRERKAYNKLYKDLDAAYARWEAYVQTIVAANDEESRRLKAQWETSRHYELAKEDVGQDGYNPNASGTGITTQDDKDKAFAAEQNAQQRTTTIIIAIAAMVAVVIVISLFKE